MERKIGEIFEYNGEWYQCVGGTCRNCSFYYDTVCKNITTIGSTNFGNCHCSLRTDHKSVIFKKLEKVGEPFSCNYYGDNRLIMMQEYNLYNLDDITNEDKIPMYITDYKHKRIAIEIKQNEEDMEEYKMYDAKEDIPEFDKVVDECLFCEDKPNLKPFDLEAAKAGKPVCTRDGRKARIICFDRISGDDYYKIVACVTAFDGDFEEVLSYGIDGYIVDSQDPKDEDLMMLPEKKEGWVNIYRNIDDNTPYTENDNIYSSRDKAKESAKMLNMKTYIDTIKISWEE